MNIQGLSFKWVAVSVLFFILCFAGSFTSADPLPGGTLDPLGIPKYVTPLVIPPEMPKSTSSPAPAADYDIAVRQFKQQILPGGLWDVLSGRTDNFPPTTIWSYGRAEDPAPDISGLIPSLPAGVAPAPNSSFNYPAFTVEALTMVPSTVRWINDLVNPVTGTFLPHLLKVDQTVHWANPPKANCAMMPENRTDCETEIAAPYEGPVPLVTHVHGAHVQPESDGYPEAWWLPGAPGTKGIPASYAERGIHFGQADNSNAVPGSAFFSYENTQAATTLWYHDHALGMTRLNVYAGPAGFWLVRGGVYGDSNVDDGTTGESEDGILPVSAPSGTGDPNFDPVYRNTIREVPIAIQDRSFNADGSLFYPEDRTFFDGFTGPYIGGYGPSDMPGIWNPEAFFNTMVVNGTTWPKYEVANGRYRLRLLNGCNSRTLNLSMFIVTGLGADGIPGTADDVLGAEVPFYQIGAEQGFLPSVVKIQTGQYTVLPGDGTIPAPVAAPDPAQALLMGPAERADVIADFRGMTNGTRIRMINTAPDAPFGGFGDPAADPLTTGQVMDFVVNTDLETEADSNTTPPQNLVLPAEPSLGAATNTRQVSLNELSSDQVCVSVDAITGAISGAIFSTEPGDPNFLADCAAATPLLPGDITSPMGPRQARLGVVATVGGNLVAVSKRWGDPMTETPSLNSTEIWEIFNATEDAHPIHVHLVAFQVVNREPLDEAAFAAGNLVPTGVTTPPNPNEMGYKDTVVAFPGEITRIKAKFDIAGLYVWHCHIVEHEDNEMMRAYCVKNADGSLSPACRPAFGKPENIGVFNNGQWLLDSNGNYTWDPGMDKNPVFGVSGDMQVTGDWTGDGTTKIGAVRGNTWFLDMNGNGAWDDGIDAAYNFGVPGDIWITGDWNGDGKTEIGAVRGNTWFLDMNGNGTWDDGIDAAYSFGVPGDVWVTGDWTGNGKTKIGAVRGNAWFLDANGNGAWDDGIDTVYSFGAPGDTWITGDWNGDGRTKIGAFRGNTWFLDANGNGAWDDGIDGTYSFGVSGDTPVVGRW